MKYLAFGLVLLLAGCGVNTSSNIDVKGTDLRYFKDPRTDMCYAIVASRKTGSFDTTGLGLTNVECTPEVEDLL
jgi:hypothetical protein